MSAEDTDFIDEKMGYFELKGRFSQAVGPKAVKTWLGLSIFVNLAECPNEKKVVNPIIKHPH